MARIEDLIDEISDPELRKQIAREVKHFKSTKRFGLVYEEHVPETVSLFGLPVRAGSIVQKRTEPEDQTRCEVVVAGTEAAEIKPVGKDGPTETFPAGDLLTVKRFEEPIYPGVSLVGEMRRGPGDKPVHSVISGENYHALQVLAYTHAAKVDVIYADPPYNTGDKSWKYNSRFVDGNDAFRHSKWLAMMEKRLWLAKKLLKPDSVLVVTIDEHEVHNLGVLLRQEFKDAYHQMVTIVINPKGVTQPRFSRAEEYAHFAFFGRSAVESSLDDLLTWGGEEIGEAGELPRWKGLLRSGKWRRNGGRRPAADPAAILTPRSTGDFDPEAIGYLTTPVDMDAWIAGSLDRWIAGSLDRWIAGSLDRWIAGSLDRWIAGSLDRWIAGSLDRCSRGPLPIPR